MEEGKLYQIITNNVDAETENTEAKNRMKKKVVIKTFIATK